MKGCARLRASQFGVRKVALAGRMPKIGRYSRAVKLTPPLPLKIDEFFVV